MKEFNALSTMLDLYPMHSEIVGIQLGVHHDGDAMIMVFLRPGHLTQGAAELIEWKRTLARPIGVAERSADGSTVNIGVTGKGTENDTDIVVWVSHIPYTDVSSCLTTEPDTSTAFDSDLLHLWAIDL